MVRVLYSAFDVVPSPKGASVHIAAFTRALVEAGCDVILAVPNDGAQPPEEEWNGARVCRFDVPREATFLEQALAYGNAVERFASQERFDVVHFRSIWGGLGLASERRARGHRTLFEVNGLPSVELPYHYPGVRDAPLMDKVRERELATLALSDAVVTTSNVTRDYLESLGVRRDVVTVIRNGVDLERFAAAPPRPNVVPTVLYLGTFADWQGLPQLIDAAAILAPERRFRVRIVGRARGRQKRLLEKRIQKQGLAEVVFVEEPVPHDAVPALLAESDVCVAPLSLGERNVTQGCCPIKVLEYMAAGRPIVAANLPVVRELLKADTEALLFAPGDAKDLARKLARVLDDPELAARLGHAAAAHARRDYGWDVAGKALVRVYERLVGGSLR